MNKSCHVPLLMLLCAVLMLASCTTRAARRFDALSESFDKKQDVSSAITFVKKNPKVYGKQAELLYWADLGVLYHYAGQYDSSAASLEKAFRISDDLFARSITNEAASLLTNDNARPYRSKPYELILLHQIAALDYLAMGKPDEALVEHRRTQLLMDEWARKDKQHVRYTDDGAFQSIAALVYGQQGDAGNGAVSLYKALNALARSGQAPPPELLKLSACTFREQGRDADIAELSLDTAIDCRSVLPLMPGTAQAELVVVGLLGRGPVLTDDVWWGTWAKAGLLLLSHRVGDSSETIALPAPEIPGAQSQTFTLKFAMPRVRTFPALADDMKCRVDSGVTVSGDVFGDYNTLASRWIDDNRNADLLRTVIRVLTRTIAAEKAKENMQTGNPLLDLALNIGTDVASAQLEQADTRGLFLPPREVLIARIPVSPGRHSLIVEIGGSKHTVELEGLKAGERRWVAVSELR